MKRGFTLIEVLAVIIILSIILVISVPSAFNILQKVRNESYDHLIEVIENSAKLHVNKDRSSTINIIKEEGFYEVTLLELSEDGFIKNTVLDSRTNEEIPMSKKVIVTINEHNVMIYCFEDREC